MCGIAGFTYSGGALPAPQAVIESMLASIAHRGPDDRAVEMRDGLVLGHNRLTVMEPEGGQQPRVHRDSGNVLVYNGEIYAHRAFDQRIRDAGGRFRDHCDTETLFWLLQLFGVDETLAMIDGMFAFAWYEAATGTLHLARDRFGQKPLFYGHAGNDLVFASEVRALRNHPAYRSASPDIPALQLYLMLEYVPGPATGIEGVAEVPAGHAVTFRQGRLDARAYWQASDVARVEVRDNERAVQTLDQRLDAAVASHLIADVPVGIFLSGGLDSSLVAAAACRHNSDVATFTVKLPYAGFDESPHATSVARALGTRHTMVELDRNNCVDGIEFLLSRVDQPFADSSMLPSYLLSRATRQHVTVALGGDGADELFLGYPNFRLQRAARLLAALPRAAGALVRGVATRFGKPVGYMNPAFLMRQLSFGIGMPAARQSLYWMSAVAPQQQSSLWKQGERIAETIDTALERRHAALDDLPLLEQWQGQFINDYLASDILQKMDRASMAVSLEVRNPFLSLPVAEFALSLPRPLLFCNGEGKRILRDVARRYLPEPTPGRRKHGFGLPVSALLRADLRDTAAGILLDSGNPMYEAIDFGTVNAWWAQHARAQRDRGKALWALLMLAAFYRNQFGG